MLCKIRFNKNGADTHISQVLTGYKLLEKQGILKLEIVDRHTEFRKLNIYDHSSIVEVVIGNKKIVYDMADGYQSINDKKIFDSHLDSVDYYFKRSYLSSVHMGMRNEKKVKPFGLNYYCTCEGNPYDFFEKKPLNYKEIRRRLAYHRGEKKWLKLCDYNNFVSNNHYDSYKILFLTRLWDSRTLNRDQLHKAFPELSNKGLISLIEEWKYSLESVTQKRIELIRLLRKEFGNSFEGGVEDSPFSRECCPDLIVEKNLTSKQNFMNLMKSNYLCIASTGLHNSIGWKTAEYVTNARAFITEPLYYEVPGGFSAPQNYLEYSSVNECISLCYKLMGDVDLIHEIEDNNAQYYKNYLKPDQIIKRTLEVGEIL